MKLSAIPQFIFGEIQARGGLPGLVIAGGVTVESPGLNFFTQEVDLAFPKPTDAPEGAIYSSCSSCASSRAQTAGSRTSRSTTAWWKGRAPRRRS
jgi:hypothetical protein